MQKIALLFVALCILTSCNKNQKTLAQQAEEIVSYLASDELEGRAPHSKGDSLAIEYICDYYRALNLEPKVPEFEIRRDSSKSVNIYTHIKGTSDKYIVIGAHRDHLGYGGVGSGSRRPDTLAIHNGADDNASGTAAVMLLAQRYANQKEQPEVGLIFVNFGAEEIGVLGSKAFVADMPVDIDKVVAMFNFDMVGNLRGGSLALGGTGTSIETDAIIDSALIKFNGVDSIALPLRVTRSESGVGPSDHTSFYAKNIPVFYITTGGTLDYHTPSDDASTLNYGGIDSVYRFSALLVDDVISRGELTFTEAGSVEEGSTRMSLKVTLGFMPDFAGEIKDGLRADVIIKNKPAYNAGMKNGDIITQINDDPITDINKYMEILGKYEKGDRVMVTLLRGAETMDIIVQL